MFINIIGGQEGVLLFTEDYPVLSMALDTTDNEQSLWVSTTDTSIKRWVSNDSGLETHI